MSMHKLIEEVKKCIECECSRIGEKYGFTYHTDHESYAILLEEVEEAKEEMDQLQEDMADFWKTVREDSDNNIKCAHLNDIQMSAVFAACELIQVAAVASKAIGTIRKRADSK